MSFGKTIAEARKKRGLSQKDLAALLKKEDGSPISPQYLNDIEHERRNPPSGDLLSQLAKVLDLSEEQLHFLAGQWPRDIQDLQKTRHKPEDIEAAFAAFRKTLGKSGKKWNG